MDKVIKAVGAGSAVLIAILVGTTLYAPMSVDYPIFVGFLTGDENGSLRQMHMTFQDGGRLSLRGEPLKADGEWIENRTPWFGHSDWTEIQKDQDFRKYRIHDGNVTIFLNKSATWEQNGSDAITGCWYEK